MALVRTKYVTNSIASNLFALPLDEECKSAVGHVVVDVSKSITEFPLKSLYDGDQHAGRFGSTRSR